MKAKLSTVVIISFFSLFLSACDSSVKSDTSKTSYNEVVDDINGNTNGKHVSAQQLNAIPGVSGALEGIDYSSALAKANYNDPKKPTAEEIQAVVNETNALASRPEEPNHLPVIKPLTLNIDEDTSNNSIVLDATDIDGDTLSFSMTKPAHGKLSGTAPNLTYTPTPDYFGSDSFEVTVNDGNGGTASASITIVVKDVAEPNHPPIINSQQLTVDQSSANNQITLEATDADNDALSFNISTPLHGTLTGTAPSLHYTPAAGFVGEDSFTYQVSDAKDTSPQATITITVKRSIPDKLKAEIQNKKMTVEWQPIPNADGYVIYYSKESFTAVDVSQYASLPNLKSLEVTDTKALFEAFQINDFDTYHFVVVAKKGVALSKASNEITIAKYNEEAGAAEGLNEVIINKQQLKPQALIDVSYTVINSSLIERSSNRQGYDSDAFTLTVKQSESQGFYLQIKNNTPRKFADINILINKNGYYIPESMGAFSIKDIKLMDINLNAQTEAVLLQPNIASKISVKEFGVNNTDETIQVYKSMQTHMKLAYAHTETRDHFYDYFLKTRNESKQSTLKKWTTILTDSDPKIHWVYRGSSAGVGSSAGITVNWPMSSFLADPTSLTGYKTYSHEIAHSFGYGHSSGLAYGWDDDARIVSHIKSLINSAEIEPYVTTVEKNDVYWNYDRKRLSFIPYSHEPERFSISNAHIIAPHDLIENIYIINNQIVFDRLNLKQKFGDQSVFLNAEIIDSGVTTNKLGNAFVKNYFFESIPDVVVSDFYKQSELYNAYTQNNTDVYFTLPPQENIEPGHGAEEKGINGNYNEYTKIFVQATHLATGVKYKMVISLKHGNKKINNLYEEAEKEKGYLEVYIFRNDQLPKGKFMTTFKIVAHGSYDPNYRRELTVGIEFMRKEQ
jgi:hypothetical protein